MRYMHKKIHFNKSELQELEKRNPTLFDLAKYVAEKAHITARVMGDNWINVNTTSNDEQLLCPSAVFHVPGTERKCGDPKCLELRCWSVYNEPSENPDKPYRPCWFRHWNDFVSDMKSDYILHGVLTMARQSKTPLQRLQAEIDRRNNRSGCNFYCSEQRQKECYLLREHDERVDYCMRHNVPIEYW